MRSLVLDDEAAEDGTALDRLREDQRQGGRFPVGKVVSLILCQYRPQMPLAIDEHPVGDLSHIPPELIRLLRAHINLYGTTSGGRIFQAAWGRIIQNSAYGIDWANARTGTRRTD